MNIFCRYAILICTSASRGQTYSTVYMANNIIIYLFKKHLHHNDLFQHNLTQPTKTTQLCYVLFIAIYTKTCCLVIVVFRDSTKRVML